VNVLQALVFAQTAVNTSTQKSLGISPWFLVLPVAIFVVVGLVVFFNNQRIRGYLASTWLDSQKKRHFSLLLGTLILPVVMMFAWDLFDLSEVGKLHVMRMDIITGCVLAIGAVAALLFQSTVIHYEDSWERVVDTSNRERDEMAALVDATKQEHEFALSISNAFRKVVTLKAKRIHELTQAEGDIAVEAFCKALNPELQIIALVSVVFELYRYEIKKQHGVNANIRVAYYVQKDGYLTPAFSTDGINEPCITAESVQLNRPRFRLDDGPTNSLAVHAAREKKIQIVEDTAKAADDDNTFFQYFDSDQRNQIKSMLVFPIANKTSGGSAEHIICVDCDKKGFFKEKDRPVAELFAENILDRMLFELDMQDILERTAGASEEGSTASTPKA